MAGEFKNQIEERLHGHTREDICLFAWLCVVRVLPILGNKGDFEYWTAIRSDDRRQTHLLSVLRALDVTATAAYAAGDVTAAYAAAYDAYADAADAAVAVAAYADAYAAYAAAAYVAHAAAYAYAAAAYVAHAAAYAYAAAYAADATVAAADHLCIDLRPLLLEDLENIKTGRHNFHHDISIYGDIWDNFQNALCDIGCEYWGNWYAQLFKRGFALDSNGYEEIETRLSVPKEYLEEGAASVGRYMERSKQGTETISETRIIILGEKGAGKTCLARRLKDPTTKMTDEEESTGGVDTSVWQIDRGENRRDVKARIWDFAGHVITHFAHRCFLSARCLYVIVYDGRTEGRNRLEYWLDHVRNYGGDSPTLILVNLRDDDNPPRLLENDLRRMYPFIQDEFFYVNIDKEYEELEVFREKVAQLVRDAPSWNNQVIPADDFRVKEKIEELFDKDADNRLENISPKEFETIASECKVEPERFKEILNSLTSLGASLWYPDLTEYDTVVLNPDWIANGIYKVINWGLRNRRTRLGKRDFAEIFNDEPKRYPMKKAEFIFMLMNKYELAYFEGEDIIIPTLLGGLPDKYLHFGKEFDEANSLLMEYRAEVRLPENIISRLIVCACEYVRGEEDIWLRGAVLHDTDAVALILEESENRISVRVKGAGQTEFISKIREIINRILDTYRSAKPESWYRIISNTAQDLLPSLVKVPLMKSGQDIKDLIATNQGIPIPGTGQTVSATPTVNIYNLIENYTEIIVHGNVEKVAGGNISDHTEYNFQNCKFDFAGDFRSLAEEFQAIGFAEEAEILNRTAEKVESNETAQTANDVRGSGIFTRGRNLLKDALTPGTPLNKKLKTDILKGCANLYKQGAQMFGW